MLLQIETFTQKISNSDPKKLSKDVNDWIEDKGPTIEVVDVMYQLTSNGSYRYHSICIVYFDQTKEADPNKLLD